jgi:hypothetical protein
MPFDPGNLVQNAFDDVAVTMHQSLPAAEEATEGRRAVNAVSNTVVVVNAVLALAVEARGSVLAAALANAAGVEAAL